MTNERVFSMSKKIVWMTALGVFCGFFLSAIFTGRGIPLIGVIGTTIGICIVMFWMKLKVTPEMLSQGKKKFRFSEGTVVFEKVSPLMSWFMFFKGNGEAIVFK
ncbi:hypothetical protein [Serratia sp. DD3]|uniref:hypothetical protein n=1 Tax=Serratia sp. DD3 TaxID=1410619 RepID=UPI0003C51B20|nr:hypothetical protein [Serratia sp. DD3]KEY58393.1 hypothetical protein SRDD_26390 [Serratia sp. DD3]